MGRSLRIEKNCITRYCPQCNKLLTYSSRKSCYNAVWSNSVCWSCKNSGINNPFYGKHHTMEHREYLRKLRTIEIQTKYHGAFFNKHACEFFEELNSFMNWNGKHAMNGGEHTVAGYWLDFYEPTENLVIEWDEVYHLKPTQIQHDCERQKIIITTLNCEFWRINENTLEFQLVSS